MMYNIPKNIKRYYYFVIFRNIDIFSTKKPLMFTRLNKHFTSGPRLPSDIIYICAREYTYV